MVLRPDSDALLAIGMNGEPLPAEHGFPVRMVVPGLYGFVSATKWLVDLELTTFDAKQAYWPRRGWAGPRHRSNRRHPDRRVQPTHPGRRHRLARHHLHRGVTAATCIRTRRMLLNPAAATMLASCHAALHRGLRSPGPARFQSGQWRLMRNRDVVRGGANGRGRI